jgi:predicted phosphate transport protein (TIGR00153 family)
MRFLPREEKFFSLFLTQTDIILEAATLLHAKVQIGNSAMADAAEAINVMEARGDEVIHEIYNKLNQTFITPIDPEDIHLLASSLDDVLDALEEAAHRLVAYKIDPIPGPVVEIAGLIEGCAKTLHKAFEALSEKGPVLPHCIEINRLEGQADDVVRRAMADLLNNETDAVRIIKLKEVYEYLELATDNSENVTDALQSVAVKNS